MEINVIVHIYKSIRHQYVLFFTGTLLGNIDEFVMLERKSWLTRELCDVPLSLDTLELS